MKGKTHAKSSACISPASPCERPGAGFASTYSTTVATALISMDVGSVARRESVRAAAMVAEAVPELHRYSEFEEVSRRKYPRLEERWLTQRWQAPQMRNRRPYRHI